MPQETLITLYIRQVFGTLALFLPPILVNAGIKVKFLCSEAKTVELIPPHFLQSAIRSFTLASRQCECRVVIRSSEGRVFPAPTCCAVVLSAETQVCKAERLLLDPPAVRGLHQRRLFGEFPGVKPSTSFTASGHPLSAAIMLAG
ncbi:MAG: hypothetical protein K9J74_09760 [Sulfuritalea sp.]|nr:hypothetical protein [Sulfuritalea sp.]